ncbi:11053_t:CDS:2 [Racocetra fulgida]|uniref:11053_t:CDS:1 n=1 Tax=Racocetra fulgida TaxID=60492 RepID=A0A9N9AU63_9GLOM|nr:11053_t:CDS:2 [Racocetra fulgida]
MQPSPSPSGQSFQQPHKQQLQNSSTFEPISFNAIKRLQKELEELNTMNLITTNIQLHNNLSLRITVVRKEMKEEEERLKKLKRYAHNKQKSEMKKLWALEDDNRGEEVKPLWVILVDGGPDENPHHLKNINQYCKLFRYLDLDYMTIRTYTPGQSSYNPVKRSMVTLSGKLAGVILKINHFGEYLNSQGEVCDYELGLLNFHYAAEDHSRRCCKKCRKYFPTTTMLVRHKKTIQPNLRNRC